MNNPQAGFSKYQKGTIKALTKLLGSDIPFSFEKSNNNHLKVFIEGLDKPMFTSSTPSDHRSEQNFISDVKAALRKANITPASEPSNSKPIKPNDQIRLKAEYCEQLYALGVKYLRSQKDAFAQQEASRLRTNCSAAALKKERQKLCEHLFEHARNNRPSNIYLTSKDQKDLKKKFFKHIQFMLPNIADYIIKAQGKPSHLGANLEAEEANTLSIDIDKLTPNENANALTGAAAQQDEVVEAVSPDSAVQGSLTESMAAVPALEVETVAEVEPVVKTEAAEEVGSALVEEPVAAEASATLPASEDPLAEFLSLAASARSGLLREQSNTTLEVLKQQIEVAIERNTQRHIGQVVELITQNNLPIERILAELEASAHPLAH